MLDFSANQPTTIVIDGKAWTLHGLSFDDFSAMKKHFRSQQIAALRKALWDEGVHDPRMLAEQCAVLACKPMSLDLSRLSRLAKTVDRNGDEDAFNEEVDFEAIEMGFFMLWRSLLKSHSSMTLDDLQSLPMATIRKLMSSIPMSMAASSEESVPPLVP
jgi:hypothetical protein